MSAIDANNLIVDLQRFAGLFQAYMECSDKLQGHARNLFAILVDPQVDEDDRVLTASTLLDVLSVPRRREHARWLRQLVKGSEGSHQE